MPTTSRLAIRQNVMSTLYAGFSPLTGTATGGSTTTLVDTKLITTLLGADHYVGAWLYIDSDAGDVAPEGECRRIHAFTPGSGTLTVDPAWSGASFPAASDTYEIHYWLHPDRLSESINRALEVGSQRAFAAISDDDLATSPIYDQDVLVEGALFYANKALLRRILRGSAGAGPSLDRVKAQMNMHLANWQRGLKERLGYTPPGFGYYGIYKEQGG